MSAGAGVSRQKPVSTNNVKHTASQSRLPKGKDNATDAPFEPCAATASHFLFAQGPTVVCLHHDTLALERRFSKHSEDIQLISVDNVSERGAGRLVVTYDVGKTAIVWDLFSGEQLSRFASYEPLLVASWMRNGNIAFGNEKGEVILFEPSTSEHVSARTIFDPITALAPSSDCKTYAIGYRNGSILLAALQPQFTILHTLNTSRTPSPIAMLTWHASSSKQKSDMLATQTSDGDLRVWSVPKPPASAAPRVIRALKRSEQFIPGRNWISWSKNGRIIQFSEGETWAWDVRTKDVTYDPVPTVEYVRAIAAHGPTAMLFTLGPDWTVQQYDVDTSEMVANGRYTPVAVPPTPPEEAAQIPWNSTSESEEDVLSPAGRVRGNSNPWERSDTPASTKSQPRSISRNSDNKMRSQETMSPSKTERTATSFSIGTGYPYSANPYAPNGQPHAAHAPSPMPSQAIRKGSRLRQEVIMSPDQASPTLDLLPFTKARLTDVPYRPPRGPDDQHMTTDDLRKQMLSVVFGWEGDIGALIQDELNQHPPNSQNAIILMKWLGYDADDMAASMGSNPADPLLDWMRLALGTLESMPETKKIGQVFVEKMLSKGDIHMAAVVLLSMGDRNDAIEVYVSQNCFMEAILLACLLMPADWQRQSHLVRKWGEHVVANSQQQLAIRCFSCTGVEPTDPWTSPTAQMMNQSGDSQLSVTQPPSAHPSYNHQDLWSAIIGRPSRDTATPVAMPAPPTPFRAAAAAGARITPQTSALKLITSFGGRPDKYKFPGLKSDDMTPINAATVTPIAESAIDRSALSPGGLGSYRLNNARSINKAMSAGTGLSRQRLPSIGETPIDVEAPHFPRNFPPRAPPTPADSGSDKEKERAIPMPPTSDPNKPEPLPPLLTAARYDPQQTANITEPTPQTAVGPSSTADFSRVNEGTRENSRPSSSRGRKPDGLSIQLDYATDNRQQHISATTGTLTSTQFESDLGSPPTTGNSYRVKSPSVSGKSIDQYISSLDQAQYYHNRPRSRTPGRTAREDKFEKRAKRRDQKRTEDLNDERSQRETASARRSPSSPVPMSPDDLRMYSQSVESFEAVYSSANASSSDVNLYSGKHQRRASDLTSSTQKRRNRSRPAQAESSLKPSSRGASRITSPGPETLHSNRRGRSHSRKEGAATRSPSSPLPMVPSEDDLRNRSGGEGALRLVSQNRSRHRSSSRRPETHQRDRRDSSPEASRPRYRSRSRQVDDREPGTSRKGSTSRNERKARQQMGTLEDNRQNNASTTQTNSKMDYTIDPGFRAASNPQPSNDRRKELAQAELEARRLSLARRPSAPQIPVPGQHGLHSKSASEGFAPPLFRNNTDQGYVSYQFANNPSRYEQQEYETEISNRGRPGTPRAMQHPMHTGEQPLPEIPSQLEVLTAAVYDAAPKADGQLIGSRSNSTPYPQPEIPDNMPRHPAYDHRVGTRAGSRNRTTSPSGRGQSQSRAASRNRATSPVARGQSRSRGTMESVEVPTMIIGSPESKEKGPPRVIEDGPAFIPELQHLMMPPPPPPPPPPPSAPTRGVPLQLQTDGISPATVPLPRSAYSAEPFSAKGDKEKGHRRGRSGNDTSGQIMGKFRGMADRMRSTSRPRDNAMMRSPQNGNEESNAPYETLLTEQQQQFLHQQPQQSYQTVLRSR